MYAIGLRDLKRTGPDGSSEVEKVLALRQQLP